MPWHFLSASSYLPKITHCHILWEAEGTSEKSSKSRRGSDFQATLQVGSELPGLYVQHLAKANVLLLGKT